MGTIYYASCRDCKVTRDLDKFWPLSLGAETGDDAHTLGKTLMAMTDEGFRAALLVSFMWKHKGHNCTVFSEHEGALYEEMHMEDGGFKEDLDFWKTEETKP